MSEPIKDGGSAFPSPTERDSEGLIVDYREWGLTKRDYFAAAALQGLLAHNHAAQLCEAGAPSYQRCIDDIAKESYQYADAMLAARERKPE